MGRLWVHILVGWVFAVDVTRGGVVSDLVRADLRGPHSSYRIILIRESRVPYFRVLRLAPVRRLPCKPYNA